MNKFTLKFQNSELEQQYQNQYDRIRYPVFLSISIMSIIIFGLLFAIGLVNNQIDSMLYLNLTILSGYLISLIITYKHKIYVSFCLIILLQIGVVYISYPYRYQGDCSVFMTNAQCYFMFYVILGFLIDFIYSIISIILTTILIICITIILELQIALSGILLGVGLIGFFCLCRSYIEWLNRQAFLLTLKDKQWEQIIQRLIKKPFILFEFDQWQFGFNLKLTGSLNFKCENTQELRAFLRESKIKDKNLEQYLFKMNQQQSNTTHIQNELNIVYQKKQQITIQIFMSTIIENQFLILLDENIDLIKQIKIENQNIKKQLVIKFITFIHQLLQMFNKAMRKQKNIIQILQQLNESNLYQQLFLVQEQQNEYQTINIEQLINFLNNKIPLKSFYTRFAMNTIKIITIPTILVLLILKLTKQLKSRDIFLFLQYPSQQEPFYIINLQEKNQDRQTHQFVQNNQFEILKEFKLKQLFAKIAYQVRILSVNQNHIQEKIIQIFMIYKIDESFISQI